MPQTRALTSFIPHLRTIPSTPRLANQEEASCRETAASSRAGTQIVAGILL